MSKIKTKLHLTNEYLTKHYTDNFSLSLTAVDLAKHLIQSGKEVTVTSLLEQIARSPNLETAQE